MSDSDHGNSDHGKSHAERCEAGSPARNRPNKAWEVEVDVYLNSAGPPADFEIATCLPCKIKAGEKNPEIAFHNRGRPGYLISFTLYDNTNGGLGSGYRFPLPRNKQDGAWSKLGTNACPTTACWEVFEKNRTNVSPDGLTLTVFNPNPDPAQGLFSYTLNVSKDGEAPYLPLDPGGDNQNGNLFMVDWS